MFQQDLTEQKVVRHIKKNLSPARFNHVLGVIELSEKLALRHRMDSRRARLTAALHDIARCWNDKKLIHYAKQHRLKVPYKEFVCRFQPILLHSFVGSDLAGRLFHVQDHKILSAIAKHSMASVHMTPFDKLIYLADLLAPDRQFRRFLQLRHLAFHNLDQAFIEGLRIKMIYLLQKNSLIHPNAVRVWNHFISQK